MLLFFPQTRMSARDLTPTTATGEPTVPTPLVPIDARVCQDFQETVSSVTVCVFV